jgi:hypothetical protein
MTNPELDRRIVPVEDDTSDLDHNKLAKEQFDG